MMTMMTTYLCGSPLQGLLRMRFYTVKILKRQGGAVLYTDYLEHYGVKGMKWGKRLKSSLEKIDTLRSSSNAEWRAAISLNKDARGVGRPYRYQKVGSNISVLFNEDGYAVTKINPQEGTKDVQVVRADEGKAGLLKSLTDSEYKELQTDRANLISSGKNRSKKTKTSVSVSKNMLKSLPKESFSRALGSKKDTPFKKVQSSAATKIGESFIKALSSPKEKSYKLAKKLQK